MTADYCRLGRLWRGAAGRAGHDTVNGRRYPACKFRGRPRRHPGLPLTPLEGPHRHHRRGSSLNARPQAAHLGLVALPAYSGQLTTISLHRRGRLYCRLPTCKVQAHAHLGSTSPWARSRRRHQPVHVLPRDAEIGPRHHRQGDLRRPAAGATAGRPAACSGALSIQTADGKGAPDWSSNGTGRRFDLLGVRLSSTTTSSTACCGPKIAAESVLDPPWPPTGSSNRAGPQVDFAEGSGQGIGSIEACLKNYTGTAYVLLPSGSTCRAAAYIGIQASPAACSSTTP